MNGDRIGRWLDYLVPRPKRVDLRGGTVPGIMLAADASPQKQHEGFHPSILPAMDGNSDADGNTGTPVRPVLWVNLDESDRQRFSCDAARFEDDPEAYAISLRRYDCVVTAGSYRGLQHGLVTLRQISTLSRDSGEAIPELDIVDWPDASVRGGHVCYHLVGEYLPYGAPDFDELVRTAERYAQCKLNTMLLELEAMFPFRSHADISCSMAFSPERIEAFVTTCNELRIDIVPLLQCLGHQYYILDSEDYRNLRETPDKIQQLCPTDPASSELVLELVDEYRRLMPNLKAFHLGGDESRQLGHCARCRSKADSEGASALYVDHVAKICRGVLERGMTPIVWSDMLEHHPDCMDRIPGQTVIAYWNYDFRNWPREYCAPKFIEAGFDVIACHGIRFGAATSHVAPDYRTAQDGIVDLTRAGVRDGIDGFVATNWTKAIPFDLSWRGYLCAAWESWTSGGEGPEFDPAYAAVWHGLYDGDAEALLRLQECLSIDVPYAEDAGKRLRHRLNRFDLSGSPLAERIAEYTSPRRRESVAKRINEARRRVTEATGLLERVSAAAKRNEREIALLDLGARTLDHKLRMGALFDNVARWKRGDLALGDDERSGLRRAVGRLKTEWAALAGETRRALAETTPELSADAIVRMKFETDEFREIEARGRMLMEVERAEQAGRYAHQYVLRDDADLGMPYLESSGSPFERGYSQGAAFRELVTLGVETWLADRNLTEKEAEKVANSRRYLQERLPDMWQEIEGIAGGAGLSPETIFDLNAFNAVPSCTAMAVAGEGGELFVGATLDVQESQRQFCCVHRSTDEAGRQIVSSLWAGTLWVKDGLNSDGLAIAVTSAPRIDGQHGHGLPQHMAAYAILALCSDVPEALGLLSDTTCSGKGINMVLADREGRVAAIEKSYDRQGVSQGRLTSLFRTNHFVTPEMTAFTKPDEDNSRARFKLLTEELAARRFADPEAVVRRLVASHGEGGVCQHEVGDFDTKSSSIVNPVDGWIEVCGGKPCTDPFVRFEV